MRIIFLGSPDFAVPSLRALCNSNHEIVAVITNPDRPGNRNKITPPAVKVYAQEHNLRVLQYSNLSKEGVEDIKTLAPDLMITVACGHILSQEILNIPKYGVINVHGSILPKYRGASPIQQAILEGESITGVTIMRTVLALDSGDIILTKTTAIGEEETAGELFERLSELGATALLEAVELIDRGKVEYIPQDSTQATFCGMLKKESGNLDFCKDVQELVNFVRAFNPWPTAFTYLDDKRLKVWKATKYDNTTDYNCGQVVCADKLIVQAKNGTLLLEEVQLEGAKRMKSEDFLRGKPLEKGRMLGR